MGFQRRNDLTVPLINSIDNVDMVDVLGNKNDNHDGDSAMAKLHVLDEHAHESSICFPSLADGVVVAGGAGVWELGNFVEIIPANTILEKFDIHYISVEDLSAVDVYEIRLYAGEVQIGCARVARTANQDSTTQVRIQVPIQPANTQIHAKVASSGGGDAATISLFYHEY